MALLHVDFFSDVLGMSTAMDVILPETTNGQIGMEGDAGNGQWKTLYLLHGMSDDHTIWQRRTSIERYAAEKGVAVVMPNGHLSFYTDMAVGMDYFTFLTRELPAVCRSFFPRMSDRREDTFVAGLSMGGYGALKCGLRAPEVFSHAAALSACTDICTLGDDLESQPYPDYFTDIFGPREAWYGSFNDLFRAAKDLAAESGLRPRLYMWCGTEDFLFDQNVRLKRHLKRLKYDLTWEQSPGDHQWKYWDQKIQTVLDWLPLGGEED
ncbi:MAG: alpha/beta hydrolase family protein [Clostridia bacterium]|nr:alpha/beta hydrolase family protein [Clostridia bacterium]